MEYIKDNWFNRTFNITRLTKYKEYEQNMFLCDLVRKRKEQADAKNAKVKEESDALLLELMMKEEAERQEAERQANENELQYYCGVYESPDGPVKGNWHESKDSLDEEIERYRVSKYKRTWYKTAILPQKFVNDIAKEHNIPIGEALECCNVPA